MCLGVPARIVAVTDDGLRSGSVDFGGVRRTVCLACTPDAGCGDWVIVHAGVAIARLDEAEATERLALLDAALRGADPPPAAAPAPGPER